MRCGTIRRFYIWSKSFFGDKQSNCLRFRISLCSIRWFVLPYGNEHIDKYIVQRLCLTLKCVWLRARARVYVCRCWCEWSQISWSTECWPASSALGASTILNTYMTFKYFPFRSFNRVNIAIIIFVCSMVPHWCLLPCSQYISTCNRILWLVFSFLFLRWRTRFALNQSTEPRKI